MTEAAFKRSIRDLQVWCSSCMVAFSGAAPIGVLIGAKRSSGTLVHKIAVHPDHLRQGHARHLLNSLGSKLAILGPPRIVAEVPESLAPACALFSACGYVEEAVLTDYILRCEENERSEREGGSGGAKPPGLSNAGFVIPVTVDDLAANGLFQEAPPSLLASAGQGQPPVCWKRSLETVTARKDELEGLAVASEERIEAYLLYIKDGRQAEVVSFRSFFDNPPSTGLGPLVARVRAGGVQTLLLPKVHPSEVSQAYLETLGFRSAGRTRLHATIARS